MPNHVQTNLKFIGGNNTFRAITDKVNTLSRDNAEGREGSEFDFNAIIPRPIDLDIISGSITSEGKRVYLDFIMWVSRDQHIKLSENAANANPTEEDIEKLGEFEEDYINQNNIDKDVFYTGKKAINNILKYGHPTWYEWNIHNWGTKWSAYSISVDYDLCEVSFCTAWSFPEPVLIELSKQYPNMTIEFEYADENIGFNFGKGRIINGEIDYYDYIDDMSEGSIKAVKFCDSVWGW